MHKPTIYLVLNKNDLLQQTIRKDIKKKKKKIQS